MDTSKIGNAKLSVITDPFKKSSIKGIKVEFEKSIFTDEWRASGIVRFTSNNTAGYQNFEGESFDSVVLQIKELINNL